MKMNFRNVLFVTTTITSVLAFTSCSKNDKKTEVNLYEKNKPIFDKMDEDFSNLKRKKAIFNNSPSWASTSYNVPQITILYYCGNTASPLGSNYVRFHYQINIDNTTRQNLIFNSRQGVNDRLELRFFSSSFGTSGDDSKVYVTEFTTWPKCIFVDRPASELVIPNYMVAGIVSQTGASTYQLTTAGPYGDPGWNGIINFSTPPTYAISKGNYIVAHPNGYGVCP